MLFMIQYICILRTKIKQLTEFSFFLSGFMFFNYPHFQKKKKIIIIIIIIVAYVCFFGSQRDLS